MVYIKFVGLHDMMNDAENFNDKEEKSRKFLLAMKKLYDWDPGYVKLANYVSPSTMVGLKTLHDVLSNYGNEDVNFSEAIAFTVYNAMIEYMAYYVGGYFGM